jgi:hypothetical protein
MPYILSEWMHDSASKVAYYKALHLQDTEFRMQVEGVFKPLKSLASKLHKFLHVRYQDSPPGDSSPDVLLRPEYDFTQFLACFDQFILEMTGNP